MMIMFYFNIQSKQHFKLFQYHQIYWEYKLCQSYFVLITHILVPISRTQRLVHCFVSRPTSRSQDVTDWFLYSAFLFHLSTLCNMSHWHAYIHRSTSKCFLLAFTHIYTPGNASGEARASVSCPRITLAWKDAARDQVTNLTISRCPALLPVPQSLTKKKKDCNRLILQSWWQSKTGFTGEGILPSLQKFNKCTNF